MYYLYQKTWKDRIFFTINLTKIEKTIFYDLYNQSKWEIDIHCQQCKKVVKHLFVWHTGGKNNALVDINRDIDKTGFKGNLAGIVRHLSYTGNAGHYNPIVYEEGNWLLCDDHRVSQIDFKDFKYSSICYLLFYEWTRGVNV